jgi:hypothetical protein
MLWSSDAWDIFKTPHPPQRNFRLSFSSAMYRHSQPRSALLPSPHTRAEPLGANRETPEPTPNAARGSEDPEDRCVFNRSPSLQYLHWFRFTTACRQKGRWINAAISFGVDIQHIFRFGIWTDSHNPDANDDDDDEYHSMYVIRADVGSLLIYCSIAHPKRENSSWLHTAES